MRVRSSAGAGAEGSVTPGERYVGPQPHVNHALTLLSTKVESRAEEIFRRYAYPDWLRAHSRLVGRVAVVLAGSHTGVGDPETVALAGYLHDVGRTPLLEGDERDHGDLGALLLCAAGLAACAELARRHPVYAVLDPRTEPRTLEEKIVNVADRRAGMRVVPIDERTSETAARHPRYAGEIERARPIVRALEAEVFRGLPFGPEELAAIVEATWRD